MSTGDLPTQQATKTYRYLRIGILGATGMLIASIALEVVDTHCFLTSISAYYYTPARAVFVGSLLAIGLALIVIKGARLEDVALNVAGMLAPVVAFVPIRNLDSVGPCTLRDPLPGVDTTVLRTFLDLSVRNNMSALIWAGLAGFVVTVAVVVFGKTKVTETFKDPDRIVERESLVDLSIFVFVAAFYTGWFVFLRDGFIRHAHLYSAGGMFVALGLAALITSLDHGRRFWRWYRGISITMLAAVVLFPISARLLQDWEPARYWVLVLEVWEILLFSLYWALQTSENWKQEVRAPHKVRRSGPAVTDT